MRLFFSFVSCPLSAEAGDIRNKKRAAFWN